MTNEQATTPSAEADRLIRRAIVGLTRLIANVIENNLITPEASQLLAQAAEIELTGIKERVLGSPGTGLPDHFTREHTLAELRRMYPEPIEGI
ncbi:hypothetical protein ACFW6M_22900 [Streptomyces nigra]|uniref:hypothetical protein n=1 Tax=Streptomyces nigra TaxID=1827580 RepID=UPI0036962B96